MARLCVCPLATDAPEVRATRPRPRSVGFRPNRSYPDRTPGSCWQCARIEVAKLVPGYPRLRSSHPFDVTRSALARPRHDSRFVQGITHARENSPSVRLAPIRFHRHSVRWQRHLWLNVGQCCVQSEKAKASTPRNLNRCGEPSHKVQVARRVLDTVASKLADNVCVNGKSVSGLGSPPRQMKEAEAIASASVTVCVDLATMGRCPATG
jgi:hypothetical protein